jgi:hypothetical protein
MSAPYVVVGASLAGMNAARTLRVEGHGGPIIVLDADGHLPYDRPPLSKQLLTGEWDPERIVLPIAKEDLDLDLRWESGPRVFRSLTEQSAPCPPTEPSTGSPSTVS